MDEVPANGAAAAEAVGAGASEKSVVFIMSLVSEIGSEGNQNSDLSYAGKCGAGAVAKVSCTVAGRLA